MNQIFAFAFCFLMAAAIQGQPLPLDPESARQIKASAEKGDPAAQLDLGTIYFNGDGVPRNDRAAFSWWQRAADRGYPPAEFEVSNAYRNGWGTETNKPQALTFLRRSAAAGYAPAQNRLGFDHLTGAWGGTNVAEGLQWLRLAATNAPESALSLAIIYQAGVLSVPKDETEGRRFMELAAKGGHPEAAYNLAALYLSGASGGGKDQEQALVWATVAKERGFRVASKMCDMLLARLTPDQIALATKRAAQLQNEIKEAERKRPSRVPLPLNRPTYSVPWSKNKMGSSHNHG